MPRIDFDLNEAVFEDVDGKMTARVRLIKAGKSKNNRIYRAEAIQGAVDNHLFDGVRMFRNHGDKPGPTLKRSLTDMVSAVESATYDREAKAADGLVEFFDRGFFEYVQRAQKHMGASINAGLRGKRSRDRSGAVEEDIHAIEKVHSVDWVVHPSAGGEILGFEEEGDNVELDYSLVTAESLKENNLEVYEAIMALGKPADPPKPDPKDEKLLTQEQVNELIKNALTAHENEAKLIRGKQAAAAEDVRKAFAEAGLPVKTQARVMAGFEGVQEYDEKAVKQAITDAQEELKTLGVGPRIKNMGPSGMSETGTKARSFSVMESVESAFGITKEDPKGDPKEGTK